MRASDAVHGPPPGFHALPGMLKSRYDPTQSALPPLLVAMIALELMNAMYPSAR